MIALPATLILSAILVVCWALTLGLTWAPCYSQVCPERYHPLGTRMHIVAYYGLLTSILFALLLRASSSRFRDLSQRNLTSRELPILRKRISVGGLVFSVWVLGVVLATTAVWTGPLMVYWTAKGARVDWTSHISQLVLTGLFAHHADILLGLLLIPVGRNSLLGRAFGLHQHTLLFAHKLLAYATIAMVLAHGITYYTYLADWIALPWYPYSNIEKHKAFDPENPNIRLDQVKQLGYYHTVSLFTGTVCLAMMLVIVVSSLPVLRMKAYTTFYYLHLLFGSLLFIGASIHSSTNFYFLLPGLLLWITDWIWRLFYGDFGLTNGSNGILEDAGNGWYRITLPPSDKRLPHQPSSDKDGEVADEVQIMAHPLQTYHLNIPVVSKLQTHAYSAAIIGSATSGPVFLFQPTSREGKSERKQQKMMKKEWSWKVAQRASDVEDAEASKAKTIRVRAEGPYCPPYRDFETAAKIVCLVGGTGVTGALSLANSFFTHRMQDSKASLTVIWTIRNPSMALLSEWQNLLARSTGTSGKLRLKTHVSSQYGRLNVDQTIRAEFASDGQAAQGSAWIYISGPAGLLTATEDVCCDLEAELRAAKKQGKPSGFCIESTSYLAAKWEV